MNYLKKKIKQTPGINAKGDKERDLEDDLYDEYVVEAPPHPSELIALGVNPDEIDANDPEKLKELYRRVKEEGKDKQVNSVLLAKQRQKEEIEEKKKTREEWKFFDSMSARVEQAVKESQKTLNQLKETSAVDKLTEPEYELKLSADEVFKTSKTVKEEKKANEWINFGTTTEETIDSSHDSKEDSASIKTNNSRRHSSQATGEAVRNPFNGGRTSDGSRLYHRNMSSFEAASLHLEHQLQQANAAAAGLNDIANPEQSDLINKMTAEFQSAIESNDKQFSTPNMNPFENFDPFETIVDDDISFPSPTIEQGNKEDTNQQSKSSNNSIPNADRPAGFFNPFETVSDDKLEADDEETKRAYDEMHNLEINYDSSSKVPNPTPVHVISPRQEDNELSLNNSIEHHHIKPAPLTEKESTSIESVIENLSIKREDSPTKTTAKTKPTEEEVEANNEVPNKAVHSETKASHQLEYSAVPRPKPTIRATQPAQEMLPKITPVRKARKTRKKSSFQEDSSESSEDDDRIQIVIKARDATGGTKKSGADAQVGQEPVLVPLLPPPPSKSSMKQARERGQVDDMPSPVMSYKSRQKAKAVDSFEDLPIGESESAAANVDDESNVDEDESVRKENNLEKRKIDEAAKREDDEEKEEEEEDDDDDDDKDGGQFVIPMTHSDDEGDNYAKPDTPLYDEDTSYVLEEFPNKYEGAGWDMMLRYPPKKKLTSNRFWKKIFVKLAQVPDINGKANAAAVSNKQQTQESNETNVSTCIALQIYDKQDDKKPMQEIPIQATYTVSEISSQQFDQFGKIFTIKLQYIFYKERVGVRQGQLARFIHTGHIGSSTTSGGHGVDPISIGAIKRMGAPIEHSPQISQIIKLGCTSYNDIKQFKNCLEDYLFRMPIHRDRALSTYKTEEVQMAVRDETYLELNQIGQILKQLARVRLFFLSFLNGMPIVEVGINDIHRQGKEVVGRMDILPVVTEEWIRLEACDLHSTVDVDEFEKPDSRLIKLTPPDATFFELMRFRVRPPRNRELPLQITANMTVTRTKVSINCDVMVPGCVSRKHGQIACENIAIRVSIPDCWIYFFREEKHFRMGSKKSVNRRPGKVKGIERFLGGGSGLQDVNNESSLIEVTSGQAKYEHHHNAIVWRAARWPKESQSAYVQNNMRIRLPLTAYDKMPENFYEYIHVEYTMPATTVSHTTLRSISVNPCDDEPPEKYVKYSAKYEYKVKMRLVVNLSTSSSSKTADQIPEASPIVIMKQPDLHGDLQREEDSDDSEVDEEEADS